jgi:hypothetical protein
MGRVVLRSFLTLNNVSLWYPRAVKSRCFPSLRAGASIRISLQLILALFCPVLFTHLGKSQPVALAFWMTILTTMAHLASVVMVLINAKTYQSGIPQRKV